MNGSAIASPIAAPELDRVGMVEWFRPGERERVETTIAGLSKLGIGKLRTAVSWADFHSEHGPAWYDWLLPYLAQRIELLPCFLYTPPSLGIEPKTSSPPRDPKAFADFLDVVVDRYGGCFEWVDLWNEPNNLNEWDWHLDQDWRLFSTMIGGAAYWMHRRGKRTLLGGMCPADVNWLRLMCERGVIEHIDAVGLHAFPGTWQPHWKGWGIVLDRLRHVLEAYDSKAGLWITETGYSTWDHREVRQVTNFVAALQSNADFVYWYSYADLPAEVEGQEGFHFDERHYHTGIVSESAKPKLLHRLLAAGGINSLMEIDRLARAPQVLQRTDYVLITGGAGFIGANLADRLASAGKRVVIYDALARDHVNENVRWLSQRHGALVNIEIGDVRDIHGVREAVGGASQVFHLAAQVAVTCSIDDPAADFEINARGTFNVLEAIRTGRSKPPLLFTSTNKVYGEACPLSALREDGRRYVPLSPDLLQGFDENLPLDLHSPYGCSKGTGDQYVLDYCRIFAIPAVVFRMSCIYGPHQYGTEDQGWVAHFLHAALAQQPITIYGTGKQLRDLLFVSDLLEAMLLAQQQMASLQGCAFNIGGGPLHTASLLEVLDMIEDLTGICPEVGFADWRPGDQPWYVSDICAFGMSTGWRPRVNIRDGMRRLLQWICARNGDHRLPTDSREVPACASR